MGEMSAEEFQLIKTFIYVLGGVFAVFGVVIGSLIVWAVSSAYSAIFKCILTCERLEGKIASILQTNEQIPEMKRDLDEAHRKLREHTTLLQGGS